jgi:hypothetical protein
MHRKVIKASVLMERQHHAERGTSIVEFVSELH